MSNKDIKAELRRTDLRPGPATDMAGTMLELEEDIPPRNMKKHLIVIGFKDDEKSNRTIPRNRLLPHLLNKVFKCEIEFLLDQFGEVLYPGWKVTGRCRADGGTRRVSALDRSTIAACRRWHQEWCESSGSRASFFHTGSHKLHGRKQEIIKS